MNTLETLSLLEEIREEITRVNTAAGETVFNPQVTSSINDLQISLTKMVHDHFELTERRRQSYSPLVQQKLREAGV